MTNQSPPSRNPTDNDSLMGLFNVILKKFLQNNVNDMLPAQVIAFDRTKNAVQVQPLISVVTTDSIIIQRAQVMSIPVVQLGGGGFTLNFPLNSGDLGFIKANDRDISLFKQTWEQSIPNTQRMHSFADAVFIPSVLTGYTINDEDESNVVLQTLDGTVRVAIWTDKVKITAPGVIIDSPTTTCTGDVIIEGNLTVEMDAVIDGDLTVHGNETVDGNVTGAGISLDSHVHTGVQSGGSNTGGPI